MLTYRFWATVMKKRSDGNRQASEARFRRIWRARRRRSWECWNLRCRIRRRPRSYRNVVTSPHHLSATMVTGRVHRMTELFGRLAPGATLEQARAELRAVYGAMISQHPEVVCEASGLHDQRGAAARAGDFGCKDRAAGAAGGIGTGIHHRVSNAANLILARTVRREGELAIRAALGASTASLRRLLLADSLLLCGAGAALGVLSARPMVAILARYTSRFSVRALDLTVDSSMLWVGALLAVVAAVLLAFVPRLPSADGSKGSSLASGSARMTGSTGRRLRVFAVTQIAASFMLLAGAGMLLKTLLSLRSAQTGFDMRNVLAMNVPVVSYGRTRRARCRDSTGKRCGKSRRCREWIAWRWARRCRGATRATSVRGSNFQRTGTSREAGRRGSAARCSARYRPDFSRRWACRLLAGRDFNDADRTNTEPVVIVSQSAGEADVSERGRGEPSHHVDRSGDEIHRSESGAAADRGRGGGHGR